MRAVELWMILGRSDSRSGCGDGGDCMGLVVVYWVKVCSCDAAMGPASRSLWVGRALRLSRSRNIVSSRPGTTTSPPNSHDTPLLALFLLYTERWLLKLQMAVPVAATLPSRCAPYSEL